MNQMILVLSFIFFTIPYFTICQDSIQAKDIAPFSHPFQIEDGQFTGIGAEILTKAVSNAHIVMLGNNARSQNELEFENALARVLDRNQFSAMILEIGQASGSVVNRLTENPDETLNQFKALNNKYSFEGGGLLFPPIPDFKNIGAAKSTQFARANNWSILSVGTESWTSFKMLTDELYYNLPLVNQQKHIALYQKSIQLLDKLYAGIDGQDNANILKLITGIKTSADYTKFIEAVSEFNLNQEIIEPMKLSIDFWEMYGNKEFYKKNKWNYRNNKVQLKNGLESIDFDFSTDKLFLKMWRGHLTNGATPNGFYGIGNTLMELADYHGHQSLCIGMIRRFYMEDSEIKDILDFPKRVPSAHKMFIEQGLKDDWVLIDLRPFTKEIYWGPYQMTIDFLKMMRSYDMIIIPKVDQKAKTNY